jgi:hypothetical protein
MALEVRSSKFPSPRSQNLHKVDFCTPKQGDQIWRIFAQRAIVNFWQFLKIQEVAQNFIICTVKARYVYFFTKNGLGYTLGDCFTSSSGHPARKAFISEF